MRSLALYLLLCLCGALFATPLRAPEGLTLDLFAVSPIFVIEPQSARVLTRLPDPDAQAILVRGMQDKVRTGVMRTSLRGGCCEGTLPNACWINPGMRFLTERRGIITGMVKIATLTNNVAVFWPEWEHGIAPGDHLLSLDEFARVTPTLVWQPVTGAEEYRLERREVGQRAWRAVYRGREPRWVDTELLTRLIDGTDYEYRVSSVAGTVVKTHRRMVSTLRPATSPARDVLATQPYHASREFELLLRLLVEHPRPAVRFSAAWELSRLRDDRMPRAVLALLQSTDQETIHYAAMILRRYKALPLLPWRS